MGSATKANYSAESSNVRVSALSELAPTTSDRRAVGLPNWFVGVVVALILLAGGWYTYRQIWKVDPSKDMDVVAITPSTQPLRGFGRNAPPRNPSLADGDGVSRRLTGSINARKGDAFIRAMPRTAGKGYSLSFDYLPSMRATWVTPAQWDLSQLGARATAISGLAKHINLTQEQRQQLRDLNVDIEMTPTEQARLEPLFVKWDKADAAEQAVLEDEITAAIVTISAAHLPAAKAALIKRCEQIPTILTADQIAKGKHYLSSPASPTTKPVKANKPPRP